MSPEEKEDSKYLSIFQKKEGDFDENIMSLNSMVELKIGTYNDGEDK